MALGAFKEIRKDARKQQPEKTRLKHAREFLIITFLCLCFTKISLCCTFSFDGLEMSQTLVLHTCTDYQ